MAIEKITAEEFDTHVLQAAAPIIVEFSAPWCVYCRRLTPVLERMDGTPGTPKIVLADIDEQPQLAQRFGIEIIPTLLLFQHGRHGEKIVAPNAQAQLEEWIASQLA